MTEMRQHVYSYNKEFSQVFRLNPELKRELGAIIVYC